MAGPDRIRSARSYKALADSFRRGEVSEDRFRAVVRESKAHNGLATHERYRFAAIAASNR